MFFFFLHKTYNKQPYRNRLLQIKIKVILKFNNLEIIFNR